MDLDAQTVIQAIQSYKSQILAVDRKVQLYLSDRKSHRYPQHEELATEIRRFENRIYNVNFGFSNTEVHMRLDGLMHSLLVYEQAWKRMFERDADAYQQMRVCPAACTDPEEEPHGSDPFVDKVFSYAQQKWEAAGVEATESKEALAKRLLPAFQAAKRKLKKGQKLSVVYDPESRQVKLAIRPKVPSVG